MENLKRKKKFTEIIIGITIIIGIVFSIISGLTGLFSVYQTVVFLGILLSIILGQFLWLVRMQRVELEHNEMENRRQAQKILKIWRHDFLNDLQMLLTLVQMKKYSRQMEYIKEITEKIHETGKILRITDVSLALFFLNQYQELQEKNVDLKIILESDLRGIPADSRFYLFKDMFGLVHNSQREERECLLIISDIQEGVKIYFNFPGDRESLDWQRIEGLKKRALHKQGQVELSFEVEEVILQIFFPGSKEFS